MKTLKKLMMPHDNWKNKKLIVNKNVRCVETEVAEALQGRENDL